MTCRAFGCGYPTSCCCIASRTYAELPRPPARTMYSCFLSFVLDVVCAEAGEKTSYHLVLHAPFPHPLKLLLYPAHDAFNLNVKKCLDLFSGRGQQSLTDDGLPCYPLCKQHSTPLDSQARVIKVESHALH